METANAEAGELKRRPSFAFAKRHGVVIIEDDGQQVVVACRPGVGVPAIQEIQRFLQRPVRPKPVTDAEFEQLLQKAYEEQRGAASELMHGLEDEEEADIDSLAQALSESQDLLESQDDAPIIKFLNGLLIEAIKENASDIHVETFESRLSVRLRVDGVLRELMAPPRALAPRITSRIKIMAKLDIAEKRLPQDGRISRSIAGRKVDVRVSTIPTGHNHERVVMRILDKQAGRLDLEQLGFGVTVFLGIRLATKGRVSLEDFERAVSAIPEVQIVEHVLGAFDYRLRVVARDLPDFERVLRRRIMTLPGVGHVEANVMLSEERRPGPLG